ncbi:unnamed protein product [Macrosiphum euphorbiae]|uniref:Uncharacterized protein n=1 Tax=Macrosiphum euphorbiae TaxID=13131 RepID=A0AAV0VNN8_9HEMI|nr:unnamed protein product [Macrosiphum euphorbiae]
MDGRKTANHNMNSKSKNIVTTPGGQDLQDSLVASGSGVKIRSNGAGLLLSLPVNRDKSDEGVSSMAPDSDKRATAETDVSPGTYPRVMLYIIHRIDRKLSLNSRATLDIHHVIGKYLIHSNDPRHNNKIYKYLYCRYKC